MHLGEIILGIGFTSVIAFIGVCWIVLHFILWSDHDYINLGVVFGMDLFLIGALLVFLGI